MFFSEKIKNMAAKVLHTRYIKRVSNKTELLMTNIAISKKNFIEFLVFWVKRKAQ